jgi:hypothetical protein
LFGRKLRFAPFVPHSFVVSRHIQMFGATDIGLLIEQYRDDQDISLNQHVKRRALELGAEMQQKVRIYLDQRFWLMLRDVILERAEEPGAAELLAQLKRAVVGGVAVCPISESVLLELLKQDDPETRKATAEIVDSLSGGATLVHADQRVAQEIVGVFTKCSDTERYHEPYELVWTKASYALGVLHPTIPDLPEKQQLPIQKAFFDTLWDMPLRELLQQANEPIASIMHDYEGMAERINALNWGHSDNLKSFRQAYLDEFRGTLGAHIHVARLYLDKALERQSGEKLDRSHEEQRAEEERLLTFFGNLISKRAGAVLIPTLHVSSICYAAVRWDKGRRLTGNDLFDFQHAQAAIAYCDAFFTEGPLKTLLQQRRKEWERDFPCAVVSDVFEARRWVASAVGS